MKIFTGSFYFISDKFFNLVHDPNLKINYEHTKRPHYFAFYDDNTKLYWLVPCSSKVEKFKQLLQNKKEQHKPTDSIKIVKVFNKEMVLLFQDMFPIAPHYISAQYIKGGQAVRISNPKIINDLEKNARKIIRLLHRGIRFTPTQPDVARIEQLMLQELVKHPPKRANEIKLSR